MAGEAFVVLNGTGHGQIHAIKAFNSSTRTYTLATPLMAALAKDTWVQGLAYQGKNHYVGNRCDDNDIVLNQVPGSSCAIY